MQVPQANAASGAPQYAKAWQELEKIRFTFLWLTVIATFIVGAFWLFFLVSLNPYVEFIIAIAIWAVLWGRSFWRYLRWSCPRCHKQWQAKSDGSGTTLIPREECPHCGLKAGT